MSICDKCGASIEFRYINGICIPIHQDGNCINYNKELSKGSCCHLTSCPRCGEQVFFIKHNGGSVWIDIPLGYPWYKHKCFDNTKNIALDHIDLVNSLNDGFSKLNEENKKNTKSGVVKSVTVETYKRFTTIEMETGVSKKLKLVLRNNADFLLNRFCFFNALTGKVWPVEDKKYVYIL